jgi:uncharacterized membrane protein YjjB (DUF3815 family)
MLGAGILAALHAWLLVLPLPAFDNPHPLPPHVVFAILAVGSIPLAVCLQARMRDLGFVMLGVLVAWGAQEVTKVMMGPSGAPMFSALVLAAVAQLQSRVTGRAPALVIVPGLLQLTPGFLGTESVLHALHPGDTPHAGAGTSVPMVAMQVVTGLVTGNVLFRQRRERELLPAAS